MGTLSKTVKKYAIDNGVNVESIAKAIGITRESLYNKMNGKTEFRLSEAARLAEVLGTSIDDLYLMTR